MNELWVTLVSITGALVSVAIIGELVSKNANTAGVINAATSGYAQDLGVALSPVTGSSGNYGQSLAAYNLTLE